MALKGFDCQKAEEFKMKVLQYKEEKHLQHNRANGTCDVTAVFIFWPAWLFSNSQWIRKSEINSIALLLSCCVFWGGLLIGTFSENIFFLYFSQFLSCAHLNVNMFSINLFSELSQLIWVCGYKIQRRLGYEAKTITKNIRHLKIMVTRDYQMKRQVKVSIYFLSTPL